MVHRLALTIGGLGAIGVLGLALMAGGNPLAASNASVTAQPGVDALVDDQLTGSITDEEVRTVVDTVYVRPAIGSPEPTASPGPTSSPDPTSSPEATFDAFDDHDDHRDDDRSGHRDGDDDLDRSGPGDGDDDHDDDRSGHDRDDHWDDD
jgi:hypothetical protein